jgi:triosephosphate isomerase
MRKRIIAGNWKMNKDLSEAVKLVSELKSGLAEELISAEIIICPPFTSLEAVNSMIKGSPIKLGAQNMHEAEDGAFTGEISAGMIKSVGCEYVILGHSERRTIFGEKDELINKKVKKAFEKGLKPIFCIGETLDEREEGVTFKIIEEQVYKGLEGLNENNFTNLIIAYEPVWAIGTGKTATPDQAQEVHKFIRKLISEITTNDIAENLIIQYGGSVKPNNAKELLGKSDIDGALVGGACLDANSFIQIILAN